MLQFNLHPSRYLFMLILLLHFLIVFLVLNLPLQWWAIIVIDCLVLASFVYMYHTYISRKATDTIVFLRIDKDKRWTAQDRAGTVYKAILQPDSICTRFIVILYFRLSSGKKTTVLIFPDSVDRISFRRLRVILNTW